MFLSEKFTLLVLGLIFVAEIVSRLPRIRAKIQDRIPGFLRLAGFVGGAGIAGILVYGTWFQYRVWANDPLSKYFLPPHTTIWYFIEYVGSRLVGPWLLAAAAGVALTYALKAMNRKFGERFFEAHEPYLAGLSVFLAGYPAFFFALIIALSAGVLLTLAYHFLKKGRAPLYFLWVPAAFFAILVVHSFLPPTVTHVFRL